MTRLQIILCAVMFIYDKFFFSKLRIAFTREEGNDNHDSFFKNFLFGVLCALIYTPKCPFWNHVFFRVRAWRSASQFRHCFGFCITSAAYQLLIKPSPSTLSPHLGAVPYRGVVSRMYPCRAICGPGNCKRGVFCSRPDKHWWRTVFTSSWMCSVSNKSIRTAKLNLISSSDGHVPRI